MRRKGLPQCQRRRRIESSTKAKIRSLPIERWPEADRSLGFCLPAWPAVETRRRCKPLKADHPGRSGAALQLLS
jgi:hypothetical protein